MNTHLVVDTLVASTLDLTTATTPGAANTNAANTNARAAAPVVDPVAAEVKRLARKLRRWERSREKCLFYIEALAATKHPDAIAPLCRELDVPGEVGRAAVAALITFGAAAEPCVRRCLDAMDEDMIRNAHRILAALGDAYSARAKDAYCWADLEENVPHVPGGAGGAAPTVDLTPLAPRSARRAGGT